MSSFHRLLMLALALLLAPETGIGAEAKSPHAPAEPQGSASVAEPKDAASPADPQARPIDTIVVVASPPHSDLPGSGIRLDEDAIRKHSYADINRVLARVPGVYLRQEEGYGLFPNISLRGVDSLRSTKVTLMEDRVPSVPAPYSAPASYYAPNIARMRGIEVLKGSSQVRYGPHTSGGVINYLSSAVPERRAIYLNALYGSRNEVRAHASAGDTFHTPVGEVGYLLEGYFGHTDGFKKIDRTPDMSSAMADETGFLRGEPMLKLAWKPDTEVHQRLEAKLGYTHLAADETYLGLTLTLGGRFEQVWQDYDDRNDPAPKASKDYAVAAGGVGATYPSTRTGGSLADCIAATRCRTRRVRWPGASCPRPASTSRRAFAARFPSRPSGARRPSSSAISTI